MTLRGDEPVIAFHSQKYSALRLATHSATGWDVRTVEADGDTGWMPSIVLSPSGTQAHVAYQHAGNADLCQGVYILP